MCTLEVSSSNAGYAAISNSVVRAARKLQMASKATSSARNSNGDSTINNLDNSDTGTKTMFEKNQF